MKGLLNEDFQKIANKTVKAQVIRYIVGELFGRWHWSIYTSVPIKRYRQNDSFDILRLGIMQQQQPADDY